jgi:hypothetical protein
VSLTASSRAKSPQAPPATSATARSGRQLSAARPCNTFTVPVGLEPRNPLGSKSARVAAGSSGDLVEMAHQRLFASEREVARARLSLHRICWRLPRGEVPVPTRVYGHGKHLISLTAVPASGRTDSAPMPRTVDGYNMYRWVEDGVSR